MLYTQFFKELHKHKVRYLVIGGIAVNLHGFGRATGDLDIIVDFSKDNLKKFIDTVKKMGLLPKIPVKLDDLCDKNLRDSWIEEKNMKVFSVYNPRDQMELIDILLEYDLDFEKEYKNREIAKAGEIEIPIISIDGLIKLKKAAGRERDKLDISALEKIEGLKKK